MTVPFTLPPTWIHYDYERIGTALVEAKTAVATLRSLPYQRRWVEVLQQLELKREVAGTSRIEGAEFTDRELDAAMRDSPAELITRSQRQAHAAVQTYRWIATVPDDRPLDRELIQKIHRHIVAGADDDHCPPGQLRSKDENVTFGSPRHRGVEGGSECEQAFERFASALQHEYRGHDPLVQALAAHYHLAAMHPFLDGNGRTARALEALLLQRAGLRDTCFIAMSNYYYDEKVAYLATLAQVPAGKHDLTPFLLFGLRGVALQARRLVTEIQHHIARELFRNFMYDLFQRLRTPRRRVIQQRQIEILKRLLESEDVAIDSLAEDLASSYEKLKTPTKALIRDVNELIRLGAVELAETNAGIRLKVRLQWPTEITESEFFQRLRDLPKAKGSLLLR